ncbi:DUF1634 domain-containing protein [Kamptonema formosum]|uniref:DUF1634 domain-containing protein n=1 Tax=Kamptonema formosum TaxID=331992 RepID=UPI00037DD722|nr:DUF1634 domain-containing protein [Oscillatoria sp. PCC 10802]
MYQFDSRSQWLSPVRSESKVVPFPLQQEAPDCDAGELSQDCEVAGSSQVAEESSDRQLQLAIANLLKYGVILASATVFIGAVLYLIRHGAEPADYHIFRGEPSMFCSPTGVVSAVLSGSRRGIIQLGLLMLIATPVIRVIFSLITFLRQRDFTYVIVTSIVLSGLLYSLIGAYLRFQ